MPARRHEHLSTKVKHAVKKTARKVTGRPTTKRSHGKTGAARGGKKTVVREHVRRTPAKKATGGRRTTNKKGTTGARKGGKKTATVTAKVSV
ncbi:hypothetical protein WJX73_010441 [Symbiochloris irregularis]|uniref:Uncharacterized protein n=1 Tax=Symbiochloris irregularis TaxID=706552 RepID=A0AAW1PBH4_9CHLO